jgi:hypothetical protein
VFTCVRVAGQLKITCWLPATRVARGEVRGNVAFGAGRPRAAVSKRWLTLQGC